MKREHTYCDHCDKEIPHDPDDRKVTAGIKLKAKDVNGMDTNARSIRADITKFSPAVISSSGHSMQLGEYCSYACVESVFAEFLVKVKGDRNVKA